MLDGHIKTKTKCDIVVERLLAQISKGEYKLGDRLPNENALCDEFAVSRVTIREAIKRLNMLGLVTPQQGRGTFVTRTDVGTLMMPMMAPIVFNDTSVAQVYDARLYIELGNARIAATHRTEADIRELTELCEKMERLIQNYNAEAYSELDLQFHNAVSKASGNSILREALSAMESFLRFYIYRATTEIAMDSNRMHRDILNAIIAGDEERAGREMEHHMRNAKRVVLKKRGL